MFVSFPGTEAQHFNRGDLRDEAAKVPHFGR
jgi:hypothetical protein